MNRDQIDDFGKPFEPDTPEAFFQCGEEAFQSWWGKLNPPGSSGGLALDYDTSRVVWAAAYEHGAAWIMLVYDGAEANAEGAHSTGEMQLACVVDRFHNGKLSFAVNDVMKYWNEKEYVLERNRTDEVISLRVLRVNQDRDR